MGFLDDAESGGKYEKLITEMMGADGIRLVVNVNDLRKALPDRARALLFHSQESQSSGSSAFEEILAIQRALKEVIGSIDPAYAKKTKEFHVGFEGSFGSRHLTARSLTSGFLNNLVCVEGIITKVFETTKICSASAILTVLSTTFLHHFHSIVYLLVDFGNEYFFFGQNAR